MHIPRGLDSHGGNDAARATTREYPASMETTIGTERGELRECSTGGAVFEPESTESGVHGAFRNGGGILLATMGM